MILDRLPMVTIVEEAIYLVRFRGAFELLLPFSYCAKEKKESVSQLPQYFWEHRTPMVFTPTHTYTQKKKVYICYIDCLSTIDCGKKEEINYEV